MKERMMVMEGFNKQEELNRYVDHLFRKYKPTQQIRELKAEILSNLEAKVADLTASGMNDHEAVQQAKNSIRSVDHLVDGNIRVFIHPFRLELVQMGLLFSLIAWILTIPFRIFGLGVLLNTILMALCIVGSIVYFAMYFSSKRKKEEALQAKKYVNYRLVAKLKRASWSIWSLFIIVVTLTTTAVQFGSHIWFARPVTIDGPYQWAVLAIKYALPFASVIVPLLFHVAEKLAFKYEAGERDEI
jgi:hypothetical protein